jgi:hypothetical protein
MDHRITLQNIGTNKLEKCYNYESIYSILVWMAVTTSIAFMEEK